MAVNNKPAGQIFIITADSVQFKVKKEETGFFIHCGESNIEYIRIANRPGNGYLRFAGKMECDKKNIESFTPVDHFQTDAHGKYAGQTTGLVKEVSDVDSNTYKHIVLTENATKQVVLIR